jgi:N6-adenosine-specific RNA methylase IME4
MSSAAIKDLPVAKLAARDCALLLWIVGCMLPGALEVIRAWGFRYVNVAFDWVKVTRGGNPGIGLGYYSRPGSEQCLLAARGKPQILSRSVRQVIAEPRREHSRKPDRFYESVVQLFPGPYLELFARERRPGWTAWGNQVDRFNETETEAEAAE